MEFREVKWYGVLSEPRFYSYGIFNFLVFTVKAIMLITIESVKYLIKNRSLRGFSRYLDFHPGICDLQQMAQQRIIFKIFNIEAKAKHVKELGVPHELVLFWNRVKSKYDFKYVIWDTYRFQGEKLKCRERNMIMTLEITRYKVKEEGFFLLSEKNIRKRNFKLKSLKDKWPELHGYGWKNLDMLILNLWEPKKKDSRKSWNEVVIRISGAITLATEEENEKAVIFLKEKLERAKQGYNSTFT